MMKDNKLKSPSTGKPRRIAATLLLAVALLLVAVVGVISYFAFEME